MKFSQTITYALAAVAVSVCVALNAVADGVNGASGKPMSADPLLKEELAYVSALIDARLPDFAEGVIAEAKKKWPAAGPKLKVLELQGALSMGQFEVVQKVVDSLKGKKESESEYWALRLSMADAYYSRTMMPECRKIYQEFFNTVKKPSDDLLDFYVDSGFKWAQICVREQHEDEAVAMFAGILALGEGRLGVEKWCTLAMEAVELMLRIADDIPADPKDKQAKKRSDYLARSEKLVDALLWKNELIIVFGKAIAMKAHIVMLRGNPSKAQNLVNDYMPQLSEIHESLVKQDPQGRLGYVRASPMPECRYLLAKLLWNAVKAEAKKPNPNEDVIKDSLFGARPSSGARRNGLGAFNHAINVFAKYPESSWASDAGDLTEEIAAFVKTRYNKEIKTNITDEQRAKVTQMKYGGAYDLYRNQDYAKAVEEYNKILEKAPEGKDAVEARGIVAECYIKMRQDAKKGSKEWNDHSKSAKEAEDFLATQYKGKDDKLIRAAGDCVLRLAAKENDSGETDRARELYDAYFANYPTHFNVSKIAFLLARKAYDSEDWETAVKYCSIIEKGYPKSVQYEDALQYMATCYGKIGDEEKQKEYLRKFAGVTKRISARTGAQLNLAQMQQKSGFELYTKALAETNDVAMAEKLYKDGYRFLAGAIKDFRATGNELEKVLKDGANSISKEDYEQYTLRHAQSLFLEGSCWERMTWPASKIPVFRGQAVKAYEKYLKAYSKGRFAPQALLKIATIYTAEKNMAESQKAFARLQKEFPDSDEAKNSMPRLASTLMEMGMKSEGVAVYRKMLETTDGKYSAGQFLLAGDALRGAEEWSVAEEAYAKAMELAKPLKNADVYVSAALIGQAKVLYGRKYYADAQTRLDEFIEKYGNTVRVLEAYDMLIDVAAEEGSREKDNALRMKSFNTAVRAIKKLRSYREVPLKQLESLEKQVEGLRSGGDAGKLAELEKQLAGLKSREGELRDELDELDLRSGELMVRKMDAEEKMNLMEQMKETRGRAIVAFQAYIMSHASLKNTPRYKEHLERCYADVLPLMQLHGLPKKDIEDYVQQYRKLFPSGKNKAVVNDIYRSLDVDRAKE